MSKSFLVDALLTKDISSAVCSTTGNYSDGNKNFWTDPSNVSLSSKLYLPPHVLYRNQLELSKYVQRSLFSYASIELGRAPNYEEIRNMRPASLKTLLNTSPLASKIPSKDKDKRENVTEEKLLKRSASSEVTDVGK
ncbi:hypothetical protein HNY73_006242 [Argiope bruennichi]|uniref:Uncharacterized protein n=1 Tax=Argiope bruennichi TaxID=94029 RepID=A0A8T0FK34_ARGBR|nr:hypothetical protein HNY73_006242 [Argiope bruennichi]